MLGGILAIVLFKAASIDVGICHHVATAVAPESTIVTTRHIMDTLLYQSLYDYVRYQV